MKAKKILVVDPSVEVYSHLKNNLTNFTYINSVSYSMGYNLALSLEPDLIICRSQQNINKPAEFYASIKNNPTTALIPIFAILKGDYLSNKAIISYTGIIDFVLDPIDYEELAIRIEASSNYLNTISVPPQVSNHSGQDENILFQLKIKQIVYDNLVGKKLKAKDFSHHFCVSHRTLTKKTKQLTGLGLMEYVNKVKIEIAAFLLLNKDCTVSEAMYHVGFKSPSYFSKLFRTYYRRSPSEFILHNRE